MTTNSDITIYHRDCSLVSGNDEWKQIYVPECWWYMNTKSSITESGLKTADVLTIRIPDTAISIRKGDCVLKGNVSKEIQTIKDLKGEPYFCVTGVNKNLFGSNPHTKVVCT